MQKYDFYLWLKDDNAVVPTAVLDEVKNVINRLGGEITSERQPEKRLLVYPLEKQKTAFWCELGFEIEPAKLTEIKNGLKHQSAILRQFILQRLETKPGLRRFKPLGAEKTGTVAGSEKPAPAELSPNLEAQLDTKLKEILEN